MTDPDSTNRLRRRLIAGGAGLLAGMALPGYAKAQVNCVARHSAEYLQYQPPSAPRLYWDAMVKRMKMVFKAPIDAADMPVIVDCLAKTYGNEQPK